MTDDPFYTYRRGLGKYFDREELTVGEGNMPRGLAVSNATMTTGVLRLAYYTAVKTEPITKLRILTAATAAAATPTLVRLGVYQIDSAGVATLVASIANDTTLLATANTAYSPALSATWQKIEGQVYAHAALVVTAATAPTVWGSNHLIGSEMAKSPMRSSSVTGQTDLPATLTAAQQAGGSSGRIYVVAEP